MTVGENMKTHTINHKILSFKTIANDPILVLGTIIKENKINECLGSLSQIKEIFAGDL